MTRLTVLFLGFVFILVAGASAQSQLKGNYDLFSGYEEGEGAGTFSVGTATIFGNGRVSYTIYSPEIDEPEVHVGKINSRGFFSFDNGVTGRIRLLSKVLDAIGDFQDDFGKGFFALSKTR